MFSAETEAYAASVAATGREWADRVNQLRETFPNNEQSFKQHLERAVYAAHGVDEEQVRLQHQQQQQQYAQLQQQQQQMQQIHHASVGTTSHAISDAANTGTVFSPAGRSYPGQQRAAPAANFSAAPPTFSTPGNVSYPHQQSAQAVATFNRGDRPAQATRPPQSSAYQTSVATPTSAQYTARPNAYATGYTAQNVAAAASAVNGVGPVQRAGSSLNPAAAQRAGPKALPPLPLMRSHEPVPPFFPISTSQAYMTTYPSRLRLGTTLLMQPIAASGQVVAAGAASSVAHLASGAAAANGSGGSNPYASLKALNSATESTLGKRQRNKIDYTEKIDIPQPSSSSEDEEEDRGGRAARAARRLGGAGTPRDSPMPDSEKSVSGRKRYSKDADVGGGGRSWLGQDPPGNLIMVQPARRHHLPWVPEHELARTAHQKATLIPIRIDIDTDTFRIRDVFTWNTAERIVTPDSFAKVFCLDCDLPFDPWGLQIANAIRTQIDTYSSLAEVSVVPTDSSDQDAWEPDLRVIINLDVQVGTLHIVDRLEWDLSSKLAPEDFAAQLAIELGLGAEAVMIIAHALREELLRLKRECLEQGLIGRSSNDNGRDRGSKRLEAIWRDWNEAKSYGPHVEVLTAEAIDALESEKERNPKRMQRNEARFAAQQRDRPGRRR